MVEFRSAGEKMSITAVQFCVHDQRYVQQIQICQSSQQEGNKHHVPTHKNKKTNNTTVLV